MNRRPPTTRSILFLSCSLVALTACGNDAEPPPPPPALPPPPPAPTWAPATVTAGDLEEIRWLEGRWRGAGLDDPFYEGFTFVNDSTIRTRTYIDSTFAFAADSGMVVLSDGVLTMSGGEGVWVVTEIDSAHIHFEPRLNAINSVTWTRESPTTWTSVSRMPGDTAADSGSILRMQLVGRR